LPEEESRGGFFNVVVDKQMRVKVSAILLTACEDEGCETVEESWKRKIWPKTFLGHPRARLDRSAPNDIWPRFVLFPRL